MTTTPVPQQADRGRWWGLVVIGLAMLTVTLDSTIVSIALPSAQADLGISDADRQWIVTAYLLAFGGLLFLGGRLADLVGRRRIFLIGLVGFAAASALGGAAADGGLLFAARALQGAFAALLAPASLSLLTTTFTDPRERSKALGIYGSISGSGTAVGFIVGGVLTEYLSWRWTMYVNVPIAIVAVVGALTVLRDPQPRTRARLDVPGAVLGTLGPAAVVYGFAAAESQGWASPSVLLPLAAGVAVLAVFARWERRIAHPLLPPRILADRERAGSLVVALLAYIGPFGLFLFITYYLQSVLAYSAVMTGLAFLPMMLAMILSSTQIAARLLPRVAPRTLVVAGLALSVLGAVLLTGMGPHSGYATLVLPALVLFGAGTGITVMTVIATSTARVDPADSGIASATINAAQQLGGSIGTALLNTIAIGATAGYLAGHADEAAATVHGYGVAMWWVVGILAAAALVAVATISGSRPGGE